MVTASRRHLTSEYADGVERLFWELEKRTMPDLGAVGAVVSAHEAGQAVDALSVGAALVVLQSMRLELDSLEASVFDAAASGGLNFESVAAVLDLPDANAAQTRGDYLRARREMTRAVAQLGWELETREARSAAAARAAAQAGRRADDAAVRAAAAARRRDELRQAQRGSRDRRANPKRAAVATSEAKIQASEAAERVAAGLLRAAAALDQCAARYEEWRGSTDDPKLRQLAEEYTGAARRYREIASRYRDISGSYKEPSR
jgi:hypothetical protein